MLEQLQEKASINIQEVEQLHADMELMKNDILHQGMAAAELARSNIRVSLSEDVYSEIEQCNQEIVNQIKSNIIKSDNLEVFSDSIPVFIEEHWNRFESSICPTIENKARVILDDVYENMKKDADSFFVDVSEDKKKLLEEIIAQLDITVERNISIDVKEKDNKKLNTATKVILLSSIPIKFIWGFLPAIVAAAGGVALKKYQHNKSEISSRDDLMSEVESVCNQVKSDIYKSYCDDVEKMADNAQEQIQKAYSRFVEKVIETIDNVLSELSSLNTQADEIRVSKETKIPELRDKLAHEL